LAASLHESRQDFIRIPSAGGCQKGAGSRDCTGGVSPNPTPPPPGAQGAPGRSPARAGQRNTRDRGPENQQELKNRYDQPLTLIWIPAPSGKRGVKPGARALAGASAMILGTARNVFHGSRWPFGTYSGDNGGPVPLISKGATTVPEVQPARCSPPAVI
jgi:hypothetical protein